MIHVQKKKKKNVLWILKSSVQNKFNLEIYMFTLSHKKAKYKKKIKLAKSNPIYYSL